MAARARSLRPEKEACTKGGKKAGVSLQAGCGSGSLEMTAPVAFRHACKGEAEKGILMKSHSGIIERAEPLGKPGHRAGAQTLMPCALRAGRLAAITVAMSCFPAEGELFSYLPSIMHAC